MARMRTLKPEAFLSLSLGEVDRGVRWTFAGLWTVCDDEGRAAYDARLLKAAVYPLDDAITAAVVEADMRALEAALCVCFYEVDGRQYVHVPSFKKHQHPTRPVPSKLPPCPKTEHVPLTETQRTAPTTREQVQSIPVVVVVEEGSSRGDVVTTSLDSKTARAEKRTDPAALRRSFDEFWAVYPKKVAKDAARRRFETLIKRGVDPAEIIAGAKAYRESRHGEDPQYTKQPDGWLNAGRWQDEPQARGQPGTAVVAQNGHRAPPTASQRVTDALTVAKRLRAAGQ